MQIVLSISVTASPLPVACPPVAKEHASAVPVAAPVKDKASPAPIARHVATSSSDVEEAMAQMVESWMDYSKEYSKIHGCGPELDGMAGKKWIMLGARLRAALNRLIWHESECFDQDFLNSLHCDSMMFDDYYGRS